VSDTLAVLPQYLIPKQAVTAFAGKVAGARWGRWTTALIRWFPISPVTPPSMISSPAP
jgi:phosphatidylserine decarboxylase